MCDRLFFKIYIGSSLQDCIGIPGNSSLERNLTYIFFIYFYLFFLILTVSMPCVLYKGTRYVYVFYSLKWPKSQHRFDIEIKRKAYIKPIWTFWPF